MIRYPIGTSGQSIVLATNVLRHFSKHAQTKWWRSEAGGQLFARFQGKIIRIEEATGPRRGDRRSRTAYHPDKRAEKEEIAEQHRVGLHYVGDWHTHPEAKPTPSPTDLDSIAECVRSSTHNLNGFILIVVGTKKLPDGLHVLIHDGTSGFRLSTSEEPEAFCAPHATRSIRWI